MAKPARPANRVRFRDARGPLGLTQRQAGGRFTRDEAEELIARLESEEEGGGATPEPDGRTVGPVTRPNAARASTTRAGSTRAGSTPTTTPVAQPPASSRRQSLARQLERVPEDLLVDELRRRGWSVTPPGG